MVPFHHSAPQERAHIWERVNEAVFCETVGLPSTTWPMTASDYSTVPLKYANVTAEA